MIIPTQLVDSTSLVELLKQDFPYGYSNIPDTIALFKIMYLNEKNDLRTEDLSPHYFAVEEDKENFLGVLSRAGYEGQPYLIKVRTERTSINVEQTLRHNLLFQFEYEMTLKMNSEIELLSVKKISSCTPLGDPET